MVSRRSKDLGLFLFLLSVFCLSANYSRAATIVSDSEISVDTVWTKAGSPYIVSDTLSILSGASLSLEPGAVVKFSPGAFMDVQGTLSAFGTSEEPIVFTSIEDDSVLGDTNSDGGATVPQAGYDSWSLVFEEGSIPELNYFTIRYANGVTFESPNSSQGAVRIENSRRGINIYGGSLSFSRYDALVSTNAIYASNADVLISSGSAVVDPGEYAFSHSYGSLSLKNISIQSGTVDTYYGSLSLEDVAIQSPFENDVISSYAGNVRLVRVTVSNADSGNDTLVLYGGGSLSMSNSLFDGGSGGVTIYGARSGESVPSITIASSTLRNFEDSGITLYNTISGSIRGNTIEKNEIGIDSYADPFTLTVAGNSISQNLSYGFYDGRYVEDGGAPADISGNWWGSATGPQEPNLNPEGLGNAVAGNITFIPWLTIDPTVALPPPVTCCSSVAFIPGIQGSRLFKKNLITENQLWEPNWNGDVQKLFMDSNGVSADPSIFVGGIVDQGLPPLGPNIYKSFIASMDGLVADNTIAGWKPLAYDWRLDMNSVVDDGAKQRDGSIENMISEIEKLAATSKTGKVTIIAHSMGGLGAKVLIDRLEAKGEAGLIDKLVLVAVPELGTPLAVAGLLHGYNEGLGKYGFNFLLTETTGRTLGQNLPGLYQLLPSDAYFAKVADPVVEFDPFIGGVSNLHDIYGDEITTSTALTSFLTATGDGRTAPATSDLYSPLVANSALLAKAAALHSEIDTMTIPGNIEVTQVAGWGLDTVRGIRYVSKTENQCGVSGGLSTCGPVTILDHQPIFVEDGDGTVVTPSATGVSGAASYYLDLLDFNVNRKALDHGTIFEAQPILDFAKNIIIGATSTPSFISVTKPVLDPAKKTVRISGHSPIAIDLYDSQGRHTGLISNPNPDSDLQLYEQNIPNSYYLPFGEGKYAGFDATASTTVKIAGTGTGTFTLNTEMSIGGVVATSSVFAGIPVFPTTEASVSFSPSGTPTLAVDLAGDGTTDLVLKPGQDFDPIQYLIAMKTVVKGFNLKKNTEKELLNKIDDIIKKLKKGKTAGAVKMIQSYLRGVDNDKGKKHEREHEKERTHKHKPKITSEEIQRIIAMLNILLNNLNK